VRHEHQHARHLALLDCKPLHQCLIRLRLSASCCRWISCSISIGS
jgi:hypothetical protein